jgi:hypothetical protein
VIAKIKANAKEKQLDSAVCSVPRCPKIHGCLPTRRACPEILHQAQITTLYKGRKRGLVRRLRDLKKQNLCPNYAKICHTMLNLRQEKGDHRPLDKHYITRFIARHAELERGKSQAMDIKRLSARDSTSVSQFFVELARLRNIYKVEDQDIYNMDETGFQMGQISSLHPTRRHHPIQFINISISGPIQFHQIK